MIGAELTAPEGGGGVGHVVELASGAEEGVGGVVGDVERPAEPGAGSVVGIGGGSGLLAAVDLSQIASADGLSRAIESAQPLVAFAQLVRRQAVEILGANEREVLID